MKLHLPKLLLAAVVAAAINGETQALTITRGDLVYSSFSTSSDSTSTLPTGVTYDPATGVLTGMDHLDLWFKLDYSKITSADQHVIYVTSAGDSDSDPASWGINTNSAGNALTGYWRPNNNSPANNGRYTNKDGETLTTVDTAAGLLALDSNTEDSDKKIILNFHADAGGSGGGTYLYDVNKNKVYDGGGLSTNAAGAITTLTVNNTYITDILYNVGHKATVSNNDSWSKEYDKAVWNKVVDYTVSATILNTGVQKIGYETDAQAGADGLANAGDIIIGGSGQLYLQTYGNNNSVKSGNDITVGNSIYLGTTSADLGGLRLATYSGNITFNGAVTLVEDAKITKEHDKGSNNTVTFTEAVSGDFVLTVAADQSGQKFDDVVFSNTVDIKGLNLGSNAEICFNGATTIDTLSMNSHSLALSGSGNVSLGGGSLSSTISNTNANLAISGTWEADSLFLFSTEATYSDGDNGYWQGGTFTIVDNSGSGAVTIDTGSTITVNGVEHNITTNNGDAVVTLGANADAGYYVNTTVEYTTGSNIAGASSIVLNGGTLNLKTGLATNAQISAERLANPGKVNVSGKVALANTAIDNSKGEVVVVGGKDAIYNMGKVNSSNYTAKATFGSDWQGTVVFDKDSSFKISSGKFNLNDYGVAGSTIQFNGTTADGYLGNGKGDNGNGVTYVANIELLNGDFHVANGWGGSRFTFTGDFKGDGGLKVTNGNLTNGLTFTFAGDMSQWSGALTHTNATNNIYKFAAANGKSSTIANQIKAAGGTMQVTIENAAAVSMTGAVTATGGSLQLTKTGGSKLTVSDLSANGGNVVLTGSGNNAIEVTNLSVASGSTVTGTADVTVTGKLDVNRTDGVNLTGQLTLNDGIKVDVTDLLTADTYTYNLASASNGVTVGTYTVTGLGDNYSSYAARVSAVNPNAAAGVATVTDSNSNTNLVLTLELVKLTVTGATGYTDGVLTLTTAEKATGAIFGESLAASVSDDLWAQIMQNYTLDEEYSITFVGADGQTYDFDGADGSYEAPAISFMGEQATQITGDGKIVGTFTIPEPTTATLSLLALAGLAARRRRK